jgi:hypothetical protein
MPVIATGTGRPRAVTVKPVTSELPVQLATVDEHAHCVFEVTTLAEIVTTPLASTLSESTWAAD